MLMPKKDKQDPSLYMASLDVDSLFTSIPLDKTIDICIDILHKDNKNTPKILTDVRGIFIIYIQIINTNINGFVQWNISK